MRTNARRLAQPGARRRAGGMTLIEILVVLVLIGIVMGIVGGNFIQRGEKAKRDAAKATEAQIRSVRAKVDETISQRLAAQREALANGGKGEVCDAAAERAGEGCQRIRPRSQSAVESVDRQKAPIARQFRRKARDAFGAPWK